MLSINCKATVASKQVKTFLKAVEITLIKQVNYFYTEQERIEEKKNITTKSSQIKDLIDVLSKSTKVVVPTDKTNSFITIKAAKYIEWVKTHLDKAAIISSIERIKEIFDSANELLLG